MNITMDDSKHITNEELIVRMIDNLNNSFLKLAVCFRRTIVDITVQNDLDEVMRNYMMTLRSIEKTASIAASDTRIILPQ